MTKTKIKKILAEHKVWLANGRAGLGWDELKDVILKHADLRGADLSGADLQSANLNSANLEGANLTDAILHGTGFRDANLTGANLYDANLCGARLTNANLTGANLTDAYLHHATLVGAKFNGANLSGANFADSIIEGGAFEQAIREEGVAQKIGFPDISWIIPGALCKINAVKHGFLCKSQSGIYRSELITETLGFFIQDNDGWNTFDMLAGDKIIRGIPHWVKYTGLSRMPEYLGE